MPMTPRSRFEKTRRPSIAPNNSFGRLSAHLPPLALFLCLFPLHGQQRDPAIEIYGLTGVYRQGNLSVSSAWRRQFGAGVLLPVGRKWAGLADLTTTAVESNWVPGGSPLGPAGPNFSRERRIVLQPSIVRLWRRDRFTIYLGGGVGMEHQRQKNRIRPVVGHDENGAPIVADEFVGTETERTQATLLVRGGVLANLMPRVVFRVGFSWLPRYADESPSASVIVGVGYRF